MVFVFFFLQEIRYFFGFVLNLVLAVVLSWSHLAEEYALVLDLGAGWIVVLGMALNGVLIGLVFRFSEGGNITKIFADAGALLLTLLLTALALHQYPSLDMICGTKNETLLSFVSEQQKVGLIAIYTGIYIYSSEGPACEKLNESNHHHHGEEGEKSG